MKQYRAFFIVGFVILWLVACVREDKGVGETAVTSTPTSTMQPMVSETAVYLSDKQLQLSTPNAQTLIQLRMNPTLMPQSFANQFDLKMFTLPYPDLNDQKQAHQWNIFTEDYARLIENDLQLYYPQEIPGAAAYLFPQHEDIRGSSNYLFGRGVIDFLNTYGHSISIDEEQVRKLVFDPYWYKGKVLIRSIPMQLDNDIEKELLLLIYHTDTTGHDRFSAGVALPVNITSQGNIQIIPNSFKDGYHIGCEQIDITHDLNQDGQNDILLYCNWHGTGFSSSSQSVFGWNEDGIYQIGRTENMDWGKYTVEVSDIDSDGFDEIVWREPCNKEHRDQCDVKKVFSWDDTATTLWEPVNIRQTPFECDLLLDGLEKCASSLRHVVIDQTDPNTPEKITHLLNYLPFDNSEARPYIEHLTYLLGYDYELSGDEENAVNTYLNLIQQFPTSPWSWLAWARLEPMPSE